MYVACCSVLGSDRNLSWSTFLKNQLLVVDVLFVLGLGLCSVVAFERWCFCFVCGKVSVVVWFMTCVCTLCRVVWLSMFVCRMFGRVSTSHGWVCWFVLVTFDFDVVRKY